MNITDRRKKLRLKLDTPCIPSLNLPTHLRSKPELAHTINTCLRSKPELAHTIATLLTHCYLAKLHELTLIYLKCRLYNL